MSEGPSRLPSPSERLPVWLQRTLLTAMGVIYLLGLLFSRQVGTQAYKILDAASKMFGEKKH
jgi:hypothetical protein